jgi:hypothetical protein
MRTRVLLAAGLWSAAASAGPVAITAPGIEGGKGFAFRQGNQCVVMTAAHVVADSLEPLTVTAAGFTQAIPPGDWVVEPALDIAHLTLPLAGFKSCVEPLDDPSWLRTARFTTAQTFTMPVRNPQGRAEVLRLRWSANQGGQFRFAPEKGQRTIAKGDSGSLIFLDDKPVGLLIRKEAASASVEAVRMDVLWTMWRDALQVEAPRITVLLAGVSEAGRPSQRLVATIYELVQRHPSLALAAGQDPRACRLAIDVAGFETSRIANPAHARWQGTRCGSSMSFGDIACRTMKGVEPPRYIGQHAISYSLVGRTPSNSVRVSNPGFQVQTADSDASRDQIMAQFLRASLPNAIDQALREGVCQ